MKKLVLFIFIAGVLSLNVFGQGNGGTPILSPLSGEIECEPPVYFIYKTSYIQQDTMQPPLPKGIFTDYTSHLLTLMSSKVGIGTSSPKERLHVGGNGLFTGKLAVGTSETNFSKAPDLKFQIGSVWNFFNMSSAKIMGYNCLFLDNGSQSRFIGGAASALAMNSDGSMQLRTAPSGPVGAGNLIWNYLTMLNNGNVGIGTTSPLTKFQIGSIWTFYDGANDKIIGRNTYNNGSNNVRINAAVASRIYFGSSGDIVLQTTGTGVANSTISSWNTVIMKNDGSVGIGTTDPQKKLHVSGDTYLSGSVGIGTTDLGNFKLRVNGKINCTEVVVTASAKGEDEEEWPDYVFSEDYNLRSLEEVASYIEENKRLPEIPSAAEVAENGVNLLEINRLLLKKVEEMTLYILQQDAKMTDMQKQIDTLKK